MFKKTKRVIGILVVLVMLVSVLAACGTKKDNTNTTTNSQTGDVTNQDSGKKTLLDPVTFTFWNADTTAGQSDDKFKSKVSLKIQELTGVTLNKDFAVGDPREKLSFMAASGEYPDFIYALEYSNIVVDAGGFVKLDELIEEYGPNIKKLYGDDLARLRYSENDPHIYFLGLPTVGQVRYEPEIGFQIQHAVLKDLGYPELKTLKQYEEAIKAYKEKYPTIDGKETLGLSLLADDWRIKISVTNPAVFATGGADDGEWYYDTKTKKASLHLRRPEEREYFRWLNHMNDIGLLDPESFVQKYDQYQAKIAEGRVLALADAKWEYVDAESALIAAGKPERSYAMLPITIDESHTFADFRPTGYSGGYGVGISTSCKDPIAAIKFLDWMCTDEAQILARWGIEGVHYDVVDGKRVFKPEVRKAMQEDPTYNLSEGIGIYSWPWPGYGTGALDPNGDYYSPTYKETIIEEYHEAEKETLKAYGVDMWKELYPQEDKFEKSPFGQLWLITIPSEMEGSVIMAKYDEITAARITEAVLTKPDNFDNVWDAYMKDLDNINCDLLEEQFNQLIEEKVRLWTN